MDDGQLYDKLRSQTNKSQDWQERARAAGTKSESSPIQTTNSRNGFVEEGRTKCISLAGLRASSCEPSSARGISDEPAIGRPGSVPVRPPGRRKLALRLERAARHRARRSTGSAGAVIVAGWRRSSGGHESAPACWTAETPRPVARLARAWSTRRVHWNAFPQHRASSNRPQTVTSN
jgi:hypothetical protein